MAYALTVSQIHKKFSLSLDRLLIARMIEGVKDENLVRIDRLLQASCSCGHSCKRFAT